MFGLHNIERLFKDNYDGLCMYSLHFVGDMNIAEDVVMDSFLKLSEKIRNGGKILVPKQYLYQMVRNESINVTKQKNISVQIDESSETADDYDDISALSDREARVWKAIDQLPPVQRKVLLMSKRDGMKHDDIAACLGISIKTVEAHLYKAYKALRGKAKEIYLMIFF